MNPRPVVAIGVSHKDVEQACLWLRWVAHLASLSGDSTAPERLVIAVTRRVTPEQRWSLASAYGYRPNLTFTPFIHHVPDECEDGYPRSASHLFLRTLEFCEQTYHGRSVLWIEADCTPLHPRWFHDLASEYETCGRAFMGERIFHAGRNSSHCTGNAIYPHDWRTRAPRILTAPEAPDHPMFGAGKGQPWDVWACQETTADLHETKLIHQIFNACPFNAELLARIRPGAALFHRCKNGTLITELARARFPEFLSTLPKPTMTFQMIGHPSRLRTLGYPDMPWKTVRRGVNWLSTCTPTEPAHEAVLRYLAGSKGVSAVEPHDASAARNDNSQGTATE